MAGLLALVVGAASCGKSGGEEGGATGAVSPSVDVPSNATEPASAEPAASAALAASASAEPAPSAGASASAGGKNAPVAGGSDDDASDEGGAPAGKQYDCGEKGQKACPMQGWMKSVLAKAARGGDPDKLAAALTTVAQKPVAGYAEWSAVAAAGAASAKAGDIPGAKESCKKCHALYKKEYIATLRDQPW